MLVVWAVLLVWLWLNISRGFVLPPFVQGVQPSVALRIAAIVLVALNGVKDFIYVFWYAFAKRSLLKRFQPVLQKEVTGSEGKVLLLYCTCNDFDGESLARSMRQDYANTQTVILDDSSKEEYKTAVDRFAARNGVRVVRRENRIGFKAGNINHFLLSEEIKNSDYRYAVILDSDEIIPENFVTECLRYFAAYENAGIVQANHIATRNRRFVLFPPVLFQPKIHKRTDTYE